MRPAGEHGEDSIGASRVARRGRARRSEASRFRASAGSPRRSSTSRSCSRRRSERSGGSATATVFRSIPRPTTASSWRSSTSPTRTDPPAPRRGDWASGRRMDRPTSGRRQHDGSDMIKQAVVDDLPARIDPFPGRLLEPCPRLCVRPSGGPHGSTGFPGAMAPDEREGRVDPRLRPRSTAEVHSKASRASHPSWFT